MPSSKTKITKSIETVPNGSLSQDVAKLPMLSEIFSDDSFRYFAHRIPATCVYAEKLVITAMPNNDDCPKVVGSLVVNSGFYGDRDLQIIEWIEVVQQYRKQGVGRKLWTIACFLLGRDLIHNPVTRSGTAFTNAMIKSDHKKASK